ncbi:MAG: hypothetical protein IKP66_10155 [Lachnospiraceae bacterium]|nr:hypothetical protein [Lachnospiraceae bacterium]
MMKRLYRKSIILLVVISLVSFNMVQFTRAGVIDDFLNVIGITYEKNEKKEENEVIDKGIEDYLDNRQKEVVEEIDEIYNNIINMDIDALMDSIDYKIPKQTVADIKEYFSDYENGLDNARYIAGTLKYKIDSVTNMGDKVVAKITYTYPSIPKIIKKVLPEIVLKNAGIIFGGNITNDTLDSALESIKNELQKKTYEVESFTREFIFEKINDEWKMIGADDIVKDLTKYANDLGKNIF